MLCTRCPLQGATLVSAPSPGEEGVEPRPGPPHMPPTPAFAVFLRVDSHNQGFQVAIEILLQHRTLAPLFGSAEKSLCVHMVQWCSLSGLEEPPAWTRSRVQSYLMD